MIKLYSGIIRAMSDEGWVLKLHPICGSSKESATEEALKDALEFFPFQDGFRDHEFKCVEIPQEVIDELAGQS